MEWIQVILAAGRSSRMGIPKFGIHVLKQAQVREFLLAGKDQKATRQIVVAGAHESRLKRLIEDHEVDLVRNPDPDSGPKESMERALEVVESELPVLMQPVDQVLILNQTRKKLLSRSGNQIIIPTHEGRRGHPPVFPPWFLKKMPEIPAGQGIRTLYQDYRDRIEEVPVGDSAVVTDLDSPELLHEARRRFYDRR